MDLFQSFIQHWKQTFPQFQQEKVLLLLAVSGGVDSVVLTDLMVNAGFDCKILHVNFQLRAQESDADESFVRQLAQKYGKEILVKKFETLAYSQENKLGIQESARILRYQWFEAIREEWQLLAPNKLVLILTAHHANDNIETVLMNFFRGTGIQGHKGIASFKQESFLVRPLLVFKKAALENYAKEHQLEYVEDSSNASDKYTRNFLRNQILPQLKEAYPNIEDNLLHNIQRMREVAEIFQDTVYLKLERLMEWKGNECHVPILKLKKSTQVNTLIWEMIRPFGFSVQQVPECIKLMEAPNGSYLNSKTYQIIRNRKFLIIAKWQSLDQTMIVIDSANSLVEFAAGKLTFKTCPSTHNMMEDSLLACLDAKQLVFPMLLRKPKSGDYFYPLGMQKKKKLNRFFIDQKLSKTQKEAIWILESNQKIVWVLGLRIDNRFKCTASTNTVLEIRFNPLKA